MTNLVDSRSDTCDGGLARRHAATCKGQHKLRTNTGTHALRSVRTHDPRTRVGEDISCLTPLGQCARARATHTQTQTQTHTQRILRGLSPRVNYTDLASAACWRSYCQLLLIYDAAWSEQRIPTAVISTF
jgi:hypothetical protein